MCITSKSHISETFSVSRTQDCMINYACFPFLGSHVSGSCQTRSLQGCLLPSFSQDSGLSDDFLCLPNMPAILSLTRGGLSSQTVYQPAKEAVSETPGLPWVNIAATSSQSNPIQITVGEEATPKLLGLGLVTALLSPPCCPDCVIPTDFIAQVILHTRL